MMRRRPYRDDLGELVLPQLSMSNDNKIRQQTTRQLLVATQTLTKRLVLLVLILAIMLLAGNPFFVNFFEEINYIFHKCSVVADILLLKQRKRPHQDKIFYYLHLSKTGGTSLIDAAHQNGLSVPVRNGLTQRDWRCCGNQDSMEAQERFFNTSRFDFVANEGDMYEAMDPTHYHYVVTLRKSQARYKSMWAQWQRDPIMLYIHPMNFTAWCTWFYEDNFMFRKICGTRCRGKLKYTLDRSDFNHTLARLHHFDSILFLEDFETSFAKFARKHEWKSLSLDKKRISPPVVGTLAKFANDDSLWDYQESALDDALYEYAQRLDQGLEPYDNFSIPVQQHLETYFQKQQQPKTS